jgi:hypothetical protein
MILSPAPRARNCFFYVIQGRRLRLAPGYFISRFQREDFNSLARKYSVCPSLIRGSSPKIR